MINIERIIQENLSSAIATINLEIAPSLIKLERPKSTEHGDLSTNVAMQLAATARRNPRQIAQDIAANLQVESGILEKVEIAGPGFINFHLGWGYYRKALKDLMAQGDQFGRSDIGQGLKIQIEFVSANPTGPLNVVSARAATVGDIMVNLYNAVGYAADREFYINDAGRQVKLLGQSVSARYMALLGFSESFPEEGYHGEYVKDLARDIIEESGDRYASLAIEARQVEFSQIALRKMIQQHKTAMEQFRVHFQTWFRESDLRKDNSHLSVLAYLQEHGYCYEKDGATWFRSEQFGDEKDRVLLTQEGEPTYFLVDIAYHRNKFERGYKKLYDIWGPDHHGYIQRMKAAIMALGYGKEDFEVEIVQQVNLLRSGEVIKMSKRAGQIIEMQELIDEVGVDAARFFFTNRKSSSHLDFDMDLARKQSDENPVFYVQYAHARLVNVILFANEQGVTLDNEIDLNRLNVEEEKQLISQLLQFPDIIASAAELWEPHRVTVYLHELASIFHHFYHLHRVVSEDRELSKARLFLVKATHLVLANGLRILGITAPEKM
ncbi:MAG: arginine--tRNA ligase [Candidatus Zhuqueibacterota bacterium]